LICTKIPLFKWGIKKKGKLEKRGKWGKKKENSRIWKAYEEPINLTILQTAYGGNFQKKVKV